MHTQARNLHGRRANKLTVTPAVSFLMQHKTERANLFYHQGNISSKYEIDKVSTSTPRRLHAPTHYCRRRIRIHAPCVGFSLARSLALTIRCVHTAPGTICIMEADTCAMNGNKETPLTRHLFLLAKSHAGTKDSLSSTHSLKSTPKLRLMVKRRLHYQRLEMWTFNMLLYIMLHNVAISVKYIPQYKFRGIFLRERFNVSSLWF